MPGKRSFVAVALLSFFAAGAIASVTPRAAAAAPAWLALVSVPTGDGDFALLGAQPAADQDANAGPPAAVSNEDLCDALVSAAHASGLPVTFFTNLIWQESRFDARTVSRAGAQGIAQFMPPMAREVGLADPFDPRQAIPAAARLLRALVDRFGNIGLAAAAYNAGARRVQSWIDGHSKLPAETRNYVVAITGRAAEAWRGVKSVAMAFAVPSAVPCNSIATFAAATRTEQAEAVQQVARPARSAAVSHAPGLHRRRHARTAAAKLRERAHGRG